MLPPFRFVVFLTATLACLPAPTRVHATSINEAPYTPLGITAPLDLTHPARSAHENPAMVQFVIPDATSTTSADLDRLGSFFQQAPEINLGVLTNKYPSRQLTTTPWKSDMYAAASDGINRRLNASDASAAEKYARAFGLNVTEFMDKVSATGGIDSNSDREVCEEYVCSIREGHTTGYEVDEWEDLSHAWALASMFEAEPKCDVTRGNVTFTPQDIKGLLVQFYNDVGVPVTFVGARGQDIYPALDSDLRFVDPRARDVNPALFHIAIVNSIGRHNQFVVLDPAAGSLVFTDVVLGYSAKVDEPRQATNYKYNAKAAYTALVTMTLTVASAYAQAGLFPTTFRKRYEYQLELDKDKNIIGGEWWLSEANKNHPDFLWIPTGKPATTAETSTGIKYSHVLGLLDASIACS